jgi:hypothetical protein
LPTTAQRYIIEKSITITLKDGEDDFSPKSCSNSSFGMRQNITILDGWMGRGTNEL